MSLYNQHLAETRPREYARVLSPLHQLIRDIVRRGITEGVFDPDSMSGPRRRSSCRRWWARSDCIGWEPN